MGAVYNKAALMSLPGLTQRRRATLALVVALCLSISAGKAFLWETRPDAQTPSETLPQLSAPTYPSTPAVADRTRKCSADGPNILPKSAWLPRLGRLSPGDEDSVAPPDFAAGDPGDPVDAASPIRAPPVHLRS
jgi:hypothetical protein